MFFGHTATMPFHRKRNRVIRVSETPIGVTRSILTIPRESPLGMSGSTRMTSHIDTHSRHPYALPLRRQSRHNAAHSGRLRHAGKALVAQATRSKHRSALSGSRSMLSRASSVMPNRSEVSSASPDQRSRPARSVASAIGISVTLIRRASR